MTDNKYTDKALRELFALSHKEELPSDFSQRVMLELNRSMRMQRIKKRCLTGAAISCVFVGIILFFISVIKYFSINLSLGNIFKESLDNSSPFNLSFFISIILSIVILLFLDYLFRKRFQHNHRY